jgi:hypothetical protein
MISYMLSGSGGSTDQMVLESNNRVALFDPPGDVDSPLPGVWRLYTKSKKCRKLPISDWDYEHLEFKAVALNEGDAVSWVSK